MIDVVERLRSTAEMFELAHAPRHTVLHMQAAADEIERLRAALNEIKEQVSNPGKWNEVVMERIIERVDETARAALGERT